MYAVGIMSGTSLDGVDFTLSLLEKFIHLNKEDIIAIITMFTAKSISQIF
ncbi:MAG: hypothetical protein ACRDD2_08470 [Sarcina sp.]